VCCTWLLIPITAPPTHPPATAYITQQPNVSISLTTHYRSLRAVPARQGPSPVCLSACWVCRPATHSAHMTAACAQHDARGATYEQHEPLQQNKFIDTQHTHTFVLI